MTQTVSHLANTAETPLLNVQALNAWYGQAQVLFDAQLQVQRGEAWVMCPKIAASSPT